MSESTRTPAQQALYHRLKSIPDGSISATARRAGLQVRQLNRLREGKNLDVRLSTLERLADALGESVGQLLGSEPPPPRSDAPPAPDPRAVRQLLRKLEGVAVAAEKVASALPAEK